TRCAALRTPSRAPPPTSTPSLWSPPRASSRRSAATAGSMQPTWRGTPCACRRICSSTPCSASPRASSTRRGEQPQPQDLAGSRRARRYRHALWKGRDLQRMLMTRPDPYPDGAPKPETRKELEIWVRERLHLPPAAEAELLAAIDAVFTR